MSLDLLLTLVQSSDQHEWENRNKEAYSALFGSPKGRYRKDAEKAQNVRAPEMSSEGSVPFAAYIAPENPRSGAYSGMSLAIFPVPDAPCLLTLVVGTSGLGQDAGILGKNGHARRCQAICRWLNRDFGHGEQIAWAKHDPTRTDTDLPDELRLKWPAYKSVFDRYGSVIYAAFCPRASGLGTREAVTAFLDLIMAERGFRPNSNCEQDASSIRQKWFECLMPGLEPSDVQALLRHRQFVILQGPPGTGKTLMATDLLRVQYLGFGRSIQFHPNTTYETFVGGLAPTHSADSLGLAFQPKPGHLMEAAAAALSDPSRPYLLHIDEINRADLSKVLGEAIFLLEPRTKTPRQIVLPYDFGAPFGRILSLPKNLHILGTMNSADRSIAIVDVAVRRRFAFVSLWPQMSVVSAHGCATMQNAFEKITQIFIEHAGEDAFNLIPGHSYFLEADEAKAKEDLNTNLGALLREYVAQGYVGGFAEPIRGLLQWLESL